MAVSFKGPRKFLTILLFIAPTLIGLFILSVYPITYNIYISFNNRNTFRPRANCEGAPVGGEVPPAWQTRLTQVLEPTCWEVFSNTKTVGRGQFYSFSDPLGENYTKLFGDLITRESLISLTRLLGALSPLLIVWGIRRYLNRQISPPRSWWLWPLGVVVVYGLWQLLDASAAITQLQDTGDFFVVLFRTILYVLACIPLFFLMGLVLALILNNEHIRGRGIWRSLLIVPWAVQSYIAALVWQFFFRGEVGTINQLLKALGIVEKGPTWLGDPNRPWLAFAAVVIINLWMSYPFFTVVILGALQSIPHEQYEAAEVDGANWWDKLTLITLPLLRPAVLPAVVLSSITTFQMFNTVWLVTRGGPVSGAGKPGFTEFVMLHAYRLFQDQNFGRMGAFAVIVFAMLFVATLFSLRYTRITKGAYE
ncbi:MAG: sugar ABC transporter permease [Chloroflexi bacterium]|nr:MAG: sugar ABC transporter permease [Chloroflexota bacterium]